MDLIKNQPDVKPISQDKMIAEQAKDIVCDRYFEQAKQPYRPFNVKENSLWVRFSPVDGAEQTAVPDSLQLNVLYLSHYPHLAENPEESREAPCYPLQVVL